MAFNRRNFMQGSLIGVGAFAAGTATGTQLSKITDEVPTHTAAEHQAAEGPKRFDPSNEPPRVRKNFYDLTDEELQNFFKAIGYMRNDYQLRDPRQWENYALTHALHCTEPNPAHQQVHWGWNFLPWHRGYLYFLERILADILTTQFGIDGSKFALPYWDWSSQHGMPNTRLREQAGLASPLFGYDLTQQDMTEADNLGFDNSALLDGNRGPTIDKPQMDPANENTQASKEHVAMTRYYMSPEYIRMILSAPWDQFGGLPEIDRTGQGLLEAGPHNCGHDWVGMRIGKNRSMGTLRSAASDPIFFMHHGNIDRIWSLYTGEQPDPTGDWGKPVYHWTDIDGKQVVATAEDIITKFTNVTYSPGGVPLTAAPTVLKGTRLNRFNVNKIVDASPLEVTLPADFQLGVPMLVDIVTGPITYTGKYVIKILADGKQIGMLNFLDGGYRVGNTDPDLTHEFSLLLTIPVGTTKITLVPPTRGAFNLDVRDVHYRPL
jgi:hypothetical protein